MQHYARWDLSSYQKRLRPTQSRVGQDHQKGTCCFGPTHLYKHHKGTRPLTETWMSGPLSPPAPRPPPPPLLWTTCCLRDNAWAFKQSASPSEGSGSWVRAALVFLWSYVLSHIMVAASHTCFSRSLGQQASNMEDKTIKLQNYRNYFYYIFIPLFNKSQ